MSTGTERAYSEEISRLEAEVARLRARPCDCPDVLLTKARADQKLADSGRAGVNKALLDRRWKGLGWAAGELRRHRRHEPTPPDSDPEQLVLLDLDPGRKP